MLNEEILLKFCEGVQVDNIKAYFAHDCNAAAAARALGKTRKSVANSVNRAKKRAADKGYIDTFPDLKIADGRKLGKVTTQINDKGEIKNVWYRQDDAIAQIENALRDMCESHVGRAPEISKPKNNNKDLLSVYAIGDMHIAMHAWAEETGVDFDVKIAVGDVINAMADLIARTNNSETAVILNLGDAIHFHDDTHSTKSNKNPLDADTRVDKAFRVTCELMNLVVEMALQKHGNVIVRNVKGNHDEELAMALRFQMDAYWRNENRVSIEMSPADTWFYQFNKVMIMATHGHQMKPDKMVPFMSAKEPKMWGETLCRRAYHGHFHSKSVIECLGGKAEGFSNLAPNDAWHSASGYLSELECVAVEFHSCGKEIGRQNYMLHQSEVGNSDNSGILKKK